LSGNGVNSRQRAFLGRLVPVLGLFALAPIAAAAPEAWRAQLQTVQIPCSDGVMQPAIWFSPAGSGSRPLLVGLHTWSTTYDDAGQLAEYAHWCLRQGWAFIRPQARGPNDTPEAMGSDRAVQDVVEAVAWAEHRTAIDRARIYLIGASGGGHLAMQLAARHPELWAGVSAWCGIADIAQWYVQIREQNTFPKYARDIEGALGGSPLTDPGRRAEAWKRSPLSGLRQAATVPLDINHGLHDPAIPFTQSLLAFNAAVPAPARLDEAKIAAFYAMGTVPLGWAHAEPDPSYGTSPPVFRRIYGNTRVTIFEGAHDIVYQGGLNWLAAQRRGAAVVWEIKDFVKLGQGVSANSR
jgi:acetyl esterase/lipase